MNTTKFLNGITKLRRAPTTYGKAPHKPIFLLTILDLFDRGLITKNKIYINGELVSAFHENWDILAPDGFLEDFTLPFFHLQNDKIGGFNFWFLKTIPGIQLNKHVRSIQTLSEMVEFACFSDQVFQILSKRDIRNEVRKLLVNHYFPTSTDLFFKSDRVQGIYMKEVQQYVLNEVPKVMKLQVAEEEMVYVRNWTFKKIVPKIYLNTCAISGMRVSSTNGRSLVDACHIVPFSKDQDDRVSNGIALCPNLHRAFDSGLVAIDQDYRVLVSEQVVEDRSHEYGLIRLKGKKIILPERKHLWPSQENLERHREERFLK